MGIFSPDQRWTSEGEPELGVGIVTEIGKGRVKIHFPMSGETRLYAEDNAPLRRVLFKPGDTIMDQHQRTILVERVEEDGDFMVYYGTNGKISESDLGDVSVKHGVDDRLLTGEVDPPQLFALRRQSLQHDHRRRVSAVHGFIGGRIDLIPHQLYIAHEVSSRYAPRVLLSDEVGLGKTIEACLIIHRLLLSGRLSRVLILVPETLVHQWFVEMLRRFNLWFHIFDEERCVALEDNAPDGNPFLDDQLILCSTTFLANSENRARQALIAGWDMLVVDEAHHLAWSPDKISPEYMIVDVLSRVAKGLLLLTATPEQLGAESHFARLRLLDPERYADYESFREESQDHRGIAQLVESLSQGGQMKQQEMSLLQSLIAAERMQEFMSGGEIGRNQLIEELLDQHGPGRVIFRNTRSAMSGFPQRQAHLIPIQAKEQHEVWLQYERQHFLADIGSADFASIQEDLTLSSDPKIDWLLRCMKTLDPAKVLLICKSKEKVLELEDALRQRSNLVVGVFHENLSIVQRDRNAAWFAEPSGARLLICSEIGSEGRNFQFAHHLILYDLPLHPEVLEQRIGRLDRIGQSHDIQIHVPYLKGSPQEVLVRWFHEGLNAFEKNLEGGNQIAQVFGERLNQIAVSASTTDPPALLESLIADTASYQQDLEQKLANGRDRLLEMNSFRPQTAQKLVNQIQAEDQDSSLEIYMTKVFEHASVDMEDLAPRTYFLHPSRKNKEAFPSISHEGISITFDRKRALSREDMLFLTWDHPMATAAIDLVLSSGAGCASFGILRESGPPAILLEALFVLETIGGQGIDVDRFLPMTPIRVVIDHHGEDLTDQFSVEYVEQKLIYGSMDLLLDNEVLMETILPGMIDSATTVAETYAVTKIGHGLDQMHAVMKHEIDRLVSLQEKNNHIRPEEIHLAMESRNNLETLIKDARIRLDAVQLIQKGG